MGKQGIVLSEAASRRGNLKNCSLWLEGINHGLRKEQYFTRNKGKSLQTDWLFSLNLSYPKHDF